MSRKVSFRVLLPIAQTASAAIFGGIGLWQRYTILNQPFLGDQTLWETTARFHVWPRAFKFAAVTNMPALLVAAATEWPVEARWPGIAEWIELLPSLGFVALVWYFVGSRLDKQPSRRRCWTILVVFTAVSALGAFTPGYIGYIYYGVMVWLAFTPFVLFRPTRANAAQNGIGG